MWSFKVTTITGKTSDQLIIFLCCLPNTSILSLVESGSEISNGHDTISRSLHLLIEQKTSITRIAISHLRQIHLLCIFHPGLEEAAHVFLEVTMLQ